MNKQLLKTVIATAALLLIASLSFAVEVVVPDVKGAAKATKESAAADVKAKKEGAQKSAADAKAAAKAKKDAAAADAKAAKEKAKKTATDTKAAAKGKLVDINTASEAELKAIPGIGDAYASKIIAGRPYVRKDQLKSRKILPAPVYDNVKNMIIAKEAVKKAVAPVKK